MPKSTIKDNDYFIGRTTGTMDATQDISQVELKDRADYWLDDSVRNDFKERFGEEAEAKFNAQYNLVAQNFNERSKGNYTASQLTGRYAGRGTGFLTNGAMDEREDYFKLIPKIQTSSGANQQFGRWSDERWDPRAKIMDSGKYLDEEGNLVDMPNEWSEAIKEWGVDTISSNDRVLPERDAKGKEVLTWFYDNKQLDPYYRGPLYMIPGYAGDFKKHADKQAVSGWDYQGAFGNDMAIESNILGSIAGTVTNFVYGTFDMFNALGASLSTGDLNEYFENNMLANQGYNVSKSVEAQEDPWSVNNMIATAADVVLQLRSGKFFAQGAINVVKGANWASKAANVSSNLINEAQMIKFAQMSSTAAMTLYAGKDMYKSAMAAGFSEGEAKLLYFTNIAALFGVNRIFNWTDDLIDGSRFSREASRVTREMLPSIRLAADNEAKQLLAQGVNETVQSASKKGFIAAVKKYSSKLTTWSKDYLIKNPGHLAEGFRGYSSVMMKEAMEEMAELAAEEAVKQSANALKKLELGDNYGKFGGKFKDIYDPGYWEEFKDGLALSAFGGAIGGAIGKRVFMSGHQDAQIKENLVDIYLSGQGQKFLDNLDRMKQEGSLGDTALSIEYDKDSQSFLPATADRMSMNDANHKLLTHQYNYIKSVVDASGGREAFNGMLDKHKDLVDHLKNTSIVNDVHSLVNEYVEISSRSGNEIDGPGKDVVFTDDMSDEEKEALAEKEAAVKGLKLEDAQRLIEIKTELADMKSGKSAEKYYMQAMTINTIFDPKHESNKAYVEKYGRDMFYNMMFESANSASDIEALSESISEKIKDNDKVINALDADLSNIDSLKSMFAEGSDVYISDKAKEKLKKLYEGFKVPSSELEALKTELEESVIKSGGQYSKKGIMGTKDYRSIKEEHGADIADKYRDFAVSYFNTRTKEQVNSVKTMKDLQGIAIEKLDGLLGRIDQYALDEEGDVFELTGGDLINELMDDSVDPENLGESLGKLMATKVDKFYDTDNKSDILGTSEKYKHIGANIKNNYAKLESIYKTAMGLPGEESLKFNPNNVGYFARGFSGDTKSITDAGNLLDQAANLHHQAMSQIAPGGIPMFSNVDETQDILNQIKARTAQIESIWSSINVNVSKDGEYKTNIVTYGGLINGLAAYRVRQAKLQENSNTPSKDILEKALNGKDLAPFMSIFNKTVIDPVAFATLSKKSKSLRTEEESKQLSDYEEVMNNMSKIYNDLKQAEGLLNIHLETAIRNSSDEQSTTNQKKSIAKDLVNQVSRINDILTYSNLSKSTEQPSEESSNLTDESTTDTAIAADYLLTGGFNTLLSTDYLLKAIAGVFSDVSGKLDSIRVKYSSEISNLDLVQIKDFVGTDLYNKIVVDIRGVLDSSYTDSAEANSILDALLKNPTGMPNRLGNEIDTRVNKLVPNKKSGNNSIEETIKAFKEWEPTFNENSLDDDSLAMAFNQIQTIKSMVNQVLSLEDKRNTLKMIAAVATKEHKGHSNKIKETIVPVATTLFFDESRFYAKYKGLLESGMVKGVPSTDQEKVALGLVSHMNTDVVKELLPYISTPDIDLPAKDLIYISGLQGTGKSTMVLGLGLVVALSLQSEKYGKENTQVLLASNTTKQVGTLIDTMNKFGMNEFLYKGLSSTKDENGIPRPKDLIDILSSVVNDNSKELDGVSTIIFDEATFIESKGKGSASTDMGVILRLIADINSKRGKDKPNIRFIAMGDGNQNGFTTKAGIPMNIDVSNNVIYTTPELTHSHRTGVTALTSFIANNLVHHDNRKDPVFTATRELSNMTSEWGKISGHGDKLGGIRFRGSDLNDSPFNDVELAQNIEKLITDTEAAKTGEKFTVGIVLPDSEVLPEGVLNDLRSKYPNNFTVTTHTAVQGDEFDYVIAKVTPTDIGDSFKDSGQEKAYARKLATTIGRARFFTTIVNNTQRKFRSEMVESITLPPLALTEAITEEVRNTKINMITIPSEGIDFSFAALDQNITSSVSPSIDDKLVKKEIESRREEIIAERDSKLSEATDENMAIEIMDIYDNMLSELDSNIDKVSTTSNDTPVTVEEKAELNDILENTPDIEEVTISKAKEEYAKLLEGNPTPEEIENALLKIIKAQSSSMEFDYEYGDGIPTVESLFNDLLGDEGQTTTEKQKMRRMLEEGYIPGYTVNNYTDHWSGLKGQELDNLFINDYFDNRVPTITDPQEYKAAQLKALRLSGESTKDVSYALIGTYDPRSDYKRMAIVAKVDGKVVVVSSILVHMYNNPADTTEAGKKLHQLYMDNLDSNGKMKAMKIKGDVKELLNFDQLGPGRIIRGDKNRDVSYFISDMKKNNPLLNISDKNSLFISTEADSAFSGDTFMIYSYNSSMDLSDPKVQSDLMKNGLSKIDMKDSAGAQIIPGFKGSIGIIRLDAKPKSLLDIVKSIGPDGVKSNRSKLVSSTITSNKSSEKTITLIAQIRAAMDYISGSPNTTDTISKYIENHKDDLQYKTRETKEALVAMLNKMSVERPKQYRSLYKIIMDSTSAVSLGTQVQGDVTTKKSKDGTKILPIVAADFTNPIAIINPKGDVSGHYRFNMGRFVQKFRDTTSGENTNLNEVVGMFDQLRSLADTSLSKGLYLKAEAFRDKKNTNNVFALLNKGTMDDIESYYVTNVIDIQTPATRIPIDKLNAFIENYKDEPKSLVVTKKVGYDATSEYKKLTALSDLSSIQTEGDIDELENLVNLRLDELETIEAGLIGINDPNVKLQLEEDIRALKSKIIDLSNKRTEELMDNPTVKDSLETLIDSGNDKAAEIAGKKTKVNKEKSNIKLDDKPSNLSEDQRKFVRTPTFKQLVGDWEVKDKFDIKVELDENGEPKIVNVVENLDGTISVVSESTLDTKEAFIIKDKYSDTQSDSTSQPGGSIENFKEDYESGNLNKQDATGGRNIGIYSYGDKIVKIVKAKRALSDKTLSLMKERLSGMDNVFNPTDMITLSDGSVAIMMDKASGKDAGTLSKSEIESIPQEHWDKFEQTVRELSERGVKVDLTKRSNLFYDKVKGFQFLDIDNIQDTPTEKFIKDENGKEMYYPFERMRVFPKEFTSAKDMFESIKLNDTEQEYYDGKSKILNDTQTTEYTVSKIYSKLGSKTKSDNVTIKPVYQSTGVKYAKSIGGVFSMRLDNSETHFGNPFSSDKKLVEKDNLIQTNSTKESVEAYIQWILQDEDINSPFYEKYFNDIPGEDYSFILQRREWIREQLELGILKGKPIVYYKELGEPSHATALDYLINQYNWNQQSTVSEVINQAGPYDTQLVEAKRADIKERREDELGRVYKRPDVGFLKGKAQDKAIEKAEKEINAKYDAELSVLEEQSTFTQSLPNKNVVVSKDEVIFADGSVIPTPNEAPQTAQFKKDLLALNERVKQMAPFIFDEESLADFKYAVHELKDSMVFKSVSALEVSNPELVHMTDLIKTLDKSILAVDSVVYDLTPEEMNSRIREVMSRDIDDKDLPNVDPSGTNLSTLLVLFHQAKNLGGSLKELEGSIVSKFITEEAMIDFDAEVMEIVNRPILSMEGIFKAMAEVQALKDKGFISPEILENAQSIMTKKAADAERLGVAAEIINKGVQPGDQLDLFGTDYEGIAMDSAIETVEELPVGRAKEKIDSILDSLRIFLPLEGGESVSNKNQALVSKKRLNKAIKKADLEHAAAVSFIVNKETRELAMEDYIKLKELVISEVDSKVDYFNKQESNRDMSIATPENLFPAFVDSDKAQGVNLTPEAKEFIEGFTSKNKSTWVSFLNSEVSYEQNKQDLEDLFYAIDKAANDDISEQIITYMERKNDDSNCK